MGADADLEKMGGNSSRMSNQEVEVYKQLTFFTEKEIFNCCKRFEKLVGDEIVRGVDSINDDRCKVSMSHVITTLDELKVNPFALCLCQVFAQSDDFLLFEEFLDMMSVLSEAAPPQVKAEWAFKVFDYDGDNLLGKEDIWKVVDAITNSGEGLGQEKEVRLATEEVKSVVDNVLNETDLNRTGFISLTEFKQIVTKSADFADSFRIKL